MTWLRKLLTPPLFEDEVEARQATMLHVILWTLMALPIAMTIYHLLFQRATNIRRCKKDGATAE